MKHLDLELDYLKDITVEMMELARAQLENSKRALFEFNHELAEEIVRTELRVNALELNIDKECENTIALFQPVATNLRFIIAVFKSVSEIERIADHADGIAKHILDRTEPFSPELLQKTRALEIFEHSIEMMDDIIKSLINQDVGLARKVFKKDKVLNDMHSYSTKAISEAMAASETFGSDLLHLHTILSKLERTGDLVTNVAELIIFYLNAEVIKHKKKNKRLSQRISENPKP